eukprot:scaffold124509_cov19-Tisochrysis_lutea.AAC.3
MPYFPDYVSDLAMGFLSMLHACMLGSAPHHWHAYINMLDAVRADDQPSKPGDEGRSESSAGDGGTENDAQSAVSGNSVSDRLIPVRSSVLGQLF